MALRSQMNLTNAGARLLASVCPGCGSDDVTQTDTMDGKVASVCRACGQSWLADYTPAARRDAQQPVSRAATPPGTTDAQTAPEPLKLADLPDALTPKQVGALVPGLDREDLYDRLNAYDHWRRTQQHGVPGLPMPPTDQWDTMLPCHRFGGALAHDGTWRGGRFMVPKSVVVRWFFQLQDDGTGD